MLEVSVIKSVNEELSIRRLVDKYKQNRVIVKSMAQDKAVASSETYKTKDILKKHGASWDKQFKLWYWSSYQNQDVDEMARKAAAAVDEANKLLGNSSEELSKLIKAYTDIKTLFEQDSTLASPDKESALKSIEEFVKDLAEETDMAAFDEKLQAFLEFISTRRGYSFNNQILIWVQKPTAKDVRSKTGWAKVGYKLKDNPQGIVLFRPPLRPATAAEREERRKKFFAKYNVQSEAQMNPMLKTKFKTYIDQPVVNMRSANDFIPYLAYDITEVVNTETGKSGEEGAESVDTAWYSNDKAEGAVELKMNIVKAMENNGITVEFKDERKLYGARGYSADGKVVLIKDNDSVGQTKTAVHEFAHELLHWGVKKIEAKDNPSPKDLKRIEVYKSNDKDISSKQVMELQAEAVGYVVMRHYGYKLTTAATYIALFDNDRSHIMDNMEIIKNTANFIIDEIQEATEGDAPRPLTEEGEAETYSITDVAKILGVNLPEQRADINEHVAKMNKLFETLMRPRWTI